MGVSLRSRDNREHLLDIQTDPAMVPLAQQIGVQRDRMPTMR
jgi:hypothetical protein